MKTWTKLKELMKNEEGLSLVELIIVLVLLVIVATCVILALTGHAALIKFILGGTVGVFVLLWIIFTLWIKFGP